MSRQLLAGLAFMLVAGLAQADCYFEGTTYEEGAVVSGHVCADGKWKKL